MPPVSGAPVAVSGAPPAISALPSLSNQFSYETLLSRCVPSTWSPDMKTMLFYNSEQGPGTEEFRTLRSRLYQMREKQPLKKVLVTSSLPKEGKSFVAANLAQAMVRQHGRRVLLIDADLRAARLHLALGTALTPGLSEYLLGEADEFGIMQRGAMENLFFIPAGRSTSNPAELVANGRLKVLLSRVELLFDWIVIDSPPAVPVSDAGLMANHCDGVLMVVRSNATPSDMARKARAEFDDKLLLGVVLNGIKGSSSAYSQYYSGYDRPDEKAEVPR
jgi:protein-tyrosine kinase